MSIDTPQGTPPLEPKQGWSTKTKWMVGCGGCLGVVVIFATLLTISAGIGINSVMQVSTQSVAAIFGPSYKAEGYWPIGLPTGQKNVKNLAMLISKEQGLMVFAAQTELPEDQADLIRTGKLQQLQAFLKEMTETAAQSHQSGSSKFKSIRFDKMYNKNLAPNKLYTVCNATIELEDKSGNIIYMPTSAALLPEANDGMVVLAVFNPRNNSTDAEVKFDSMQKSLQEQALQIIHDSELDDRISVSGAAPKSSSKAAHAQ